MEARHILCYHLPSHSIKATERITTAYEEYNSTERLYHNYACCMSCDKCGWELILNYVNPPGNEWLWMKLARAFEKQIPANCNEAKDLRIVKDILES